MNEHTSNGDEGVSGYRVLSLSWTAVAVQLLLTSTHSSNCCHVGVQAQLNSCSIFLKESGDLDFYRETT